MVCMSYKILNKIKHDNSDFITIHSCKMLLLLVVMTVELNDLTLKKIIFYSVPSNL